jgi:hypothetical protein
MRNVTNVQCVMSNAVSYKGCSDGTFAPKMAEIGQQIRKL